MPLSTMFTVLSQLSNNEINQRYIMEEFISLLRKHKFSESKINELNKRVIFSPQGLLHLWKWLFAYGDESRLNFEVDVELGLKTLIYHCLITSDHLYLKDIDLKYQMVSNASFNLQEDVGASIARTAYIYFILAQDKTLYEKKEFIDINSDFETKYGYTIKEYLAILFGFIAVFMKRGDIGQNWVKNIDLIFSDTKLANKATTIISPLIINFHEAKNWSINTLDSTWDFSLFKQKPLFIIDNKNIMPISLKVLYEQVFIGLFHKIRQCYDENDKRFLSFFGRPFEKYIERVTANSISLSKLPFVIIPEFNYGKDSSKRSPDMMVRLGDKLLAVEAKSHRMTIRSQIEMNPDGIERDINKMIIKPIKQVHDKVKELMENKHSQLVGVKEVYLMVVNLGDFPSLPPIEAQIAENLKKYFKIPIKSYFHLSVEEYEMLCYLSEKKQIFKVLDNKSRLAPDLDFKNFLYRSSLAMRSLKISV